MLTELAGNVDGAASNVATLTVWEPCASLIIAGAKSVEFRTRRPPAKYVGLRIGIHAARRDCDWDQVHLLAANLANPSTSFWGQNGLDAEKAKLVIQSMIGDYWVFKYGHVIGTVRLNYSEQGKALHRVLSLDADTDKVGWFITAPRKLSPPELARGMQNFFQWLPTPRSTEEIAR